MQLDRTFIAIRKRTLVELWDLTLQVLRTHFFALVKLLLIGALPWCLLNFALTFWMVSDNNYSEYVWWFYWINLLLVASQAQVATCLVSSYLGHAMFDQNPNIKATLGDVRDRGLWFWWLHLAIRMVLPAIALVVFGLMAEWGSEVYWGFLLFCVVGFGMIVRARTPYLNELLLLEKAPRKSDPNSASVQIKFAERSRGIHSVVGADLMSRSLLSGLISVGLLYAVFASLCLLVGVLNFGTFSYNGVYHFLWQPALWIVAGIVAINRFLAYIDLRIRTEGWSVMLRMKAEANRQRTQTEIG